MELHDYFCANPLPEDLSGLVKKEFSISLDFRYGDLVLKNPLLVAPGQLTLTVSQVKEIKKAGYAGCVLKSVVGESPEGECAMKNQRKKATLIKSFYETHDREEAFPIIHWDGRCDIRNLEEYLHFAREVWKENEPGRFTVIASLLCHLPLPGENFLEEEWFYTTKLLHEIGFNYFEIDFCPFLSGDNYTEDQKNVLRWYRVCPGLMKAVSKEIKVFPKILNLDWGLEYQLKIVEAAAEGGADGLVVANRIYKKEYGSGHGGVELRERNLVQVEKARKSFPDLPVSGTGGIYSGRHVFQYLKAGAENIQLLSYLMGRVKKPFAKKIGNKFDKVLHHLIFDPVDGLISSFISSS